jgi:ABC-2 type transport system permease protein
MDNTSSLRMVKESGWRTGFANLFKANNASWWHTRKWLIQTIIWFFLMLAVLGTTLLKVPAETVSAYAQSLVNLKTIEAVQQNPIAMGLMLYFMILALALPVATIITGQEAFINERQSGTAAWILSKPVSRPAFILSKLAASIIGFSVTGIVIQGTVAYILLSLKIGSPYPAAGFLGAMGLSFLNVLFYLTLTYMLGTLVKNRGPIMGVALAVALVGPAGLRGVSILNDITPWTFFISIGDEVPSGLALALGQSMGSSTRVILTALMSLVFIVVTILRFRKEEF